MRRLVFIPIADFIQEDPDMARRTVPIASRPAPASAARFPTAPPEYGPYRYVSDLLEYVKNAPPPQPNCPPVTLEKTLVFDMAKPDNWDLLEPALKWETKRSMYLSIPTRCSRANYDSDYLKTTYVAQLLCFEEDEDSANSAARVYIPKHDYYARFEVAEHPNTATQFLNTSVLLLQAIPGLITVPVAAARRPPVKFIKMQHCDVATSVVTFARAALYKKVKEGRVVKRKMCVKYGGRA